MKFKTEEIEMEIKIIENTNNYPLTYKPKLHHGKPFQTCKISLNKNAQFFKKRSKLNKSGNNTISANTNNIYSKKNVNFTECLINCSTSSIEDNSISKQTITMLKQRNNSTEYSHPLNHMLTDKDSIKVDDNKQQQSDDLKEQAKIYVDVFEKTKKAGEAIGFKVFFGCELRLVIQPNKPEFLLYGLKIEDFLDTYPLYNEDQKTVFDFCNKNDILMVQAHPYRTEQGYFPADMKYVHGVEVYNPHPSFDPRVEESLKLANENNLIKTIGSDFHFKSQGGNTAMIFPDDTNDQFMVRDYLKKGKVQFYTRDKNIVIH